MMIVSALFALFLHEFAHLALALMLRVRIYAAGMSWKGPYIRRESGEDAQNLAITLAGPAINLLLAFLTRGSNPHFALYNLVLGITNLLPVTGSDGNRAYLILASRAAKSGGVDPVMAEAVARDVGAISQDEQRAA